MRILGIDPGLATTGYAILDKSPLNALDWGIISTPKSDDTAERLLTLQKDLDKLIKKYHPKMAVVESIYFAKNVKTAIQVAQARGVILAGLQSKRIKILELTPLQMKSQITSYGAADKSQVQYMVKNILKLKTVPKPDDAADALALAICGASHHDKIQKI